MSWQTVTLGDIATFSNGINFDKSAYTSGVKFIGVSNFGDRFKPDYSELSEVKKEVVRKSDYLADGDIVFVRSNGNKALVGRCMLVQNAPEPVTFSGFCIRCHITDTTLFDPVFMTYHFKSAMFRQAMSGTAVGANIQNLSQGRMTAYTAKIPDIETQRRIASILSAYDDLVENNRKQIKLLEEAAQRLYKEWFVDLRFPGWETAEIVDGVPVGWTNTPIDCVFEIKYGKTLSTSRISLSGKYPVYGANGVIGYYNEKNCDDYVVLITSRGNGSGDVSRTHDKESFITNNSFTVKSRSESVGLPFIHQLMNYTDFKTICTGSAQPQLTNNSISALSVIVPEESLISAFCRIVSPWYSKIECILVQNKKMTEARDRLLPKLMSGEIEV